MSPCPGETDYNKQKEKKEQTHISLWEWGEEERDRVGRVAFPLLLDKLIRLADD